MSGPLKPIRIHHHHALILQIHNEASLYRATRKTERCFCPTYAMPLPHIGGLARFFFWEVLILCHYYYVLCVLATKARIVTALSERFKTILPHSSALFQESSFGVRGEYRCSND